MFPSIPGFEGRSPQVCDGSVYSIRHTTSGKVRLDFEFGSSPRVPQMIGGRYSLCRRVVLRSDRKRDPSQSCPASENHRTQRVKWTVTNAHPDVKHCVRPVPGRGETPCTGTHRRADRADNYVGSATPESQSRFGALRVYRRYRRCGCQAAARWCAMCRFVATAGPDAESCHCWCTVRLVGLWGGRPIARQRSVVAHPITRIRFRMFCSAAALTIVVFFSVLTHDVAMASIVAITGDPASSPTLVSHVTVDASTDADAPTPPDDCRGDDHASVITGQHRLALPSALLDTGHPLLMLSDQSAAVPQSAPPPSAAVRRTMLQVFLN